MSARTPPWVLGWLLAADVGHAAEFTPSGLRWEKLPAIPNRAGLGAPYAGVSQGKLLVAGGANFPQAPVWEGGKKSWCDTVYALAEPQGKWQEAGRLVRPMGYGVSVTAPAGVICAGGSDQYQHYRDVFVLRVGPGGLETKALPPLPQPMANGCGAVCENTLYVAGGIESPNATNALHTFWALDLTAAKPAWADLGPWPGPARMLSVAASMDGAFFLISGASLSCDADGKLVRSYLTDVYCYRPGQGWKRRADIPRPALGAPSPAPVLDNAGIVVLSGDDGTRLNFQPVQRHPGFTKDVLIYRAASDTWTRVGEVAATQVTVPAVAWGDRYIIPNGEIRPGVRTPDVWSFSVKQPPTRPPAAEK